MSRSENPDSLLRVLTDVAAIADELGLPYAVAGSMALAIWVQPRSTYDVDLVLGASRADASHIVDRLRRLRHLVLEPEILWMPRLSIIRVPGLDACRSTHDSILVDLLLFEPDVWQGVMSRRQSVLAPDGQPYWFCSAEDVIVLKLLAGRRQDIVDLYAVLERRHLELDWECADQTAATLGLTTEWQQVRQKWESK